MKVVVLLLLAACASAQGGPNGPQDKPGYEQTEAPDKQVEYVTGPNVGIVGPTVLGGQGQEVQPSGEELQSTDKEQRDVSSQGVVYSGYQQELPGQQDVSKGQADAAYARYAASLNYSGSKYAQSQNQEPRPHPRKPHKKLQIVKIASKPTTQKAAYYQGVEPERYIHSQEQYYEPQEQNSQHQSNPSPSPSPQNYEQLQNQGQEEGRAPENQAKSDAPNTSQESQSQGEGSEGQQAPPTNETPVYIPQEYLQYQLAPQKGQVSSPQSTIEFPGKDQLQLFLPQEASGIINGHEQPQITAVPHLQSIQNGHQIQFIPAYITPQPATLQRERQIHHPSVQIIRQPHQPVKQQPTLMLHNAYSSSPINPSIYHRAQPRPQLYASELHPSQMSSSQQAHASKGQSPQLHSNFQPSQYQPFSNDQTQYLQHSNEALRRPQSVNFQQKQSAPSIQLAHKIPATKPTNNFFQPQSFPLNYRQKSTERLPQRQPEHLAHVSQSPLKTTQHRQTHDPPPTHLSEQVYRPESSQTTDDKPEPPPQVRPYSPKIQTPQHIQNPTTFPVKVVQIQPQIQIPLTQYELGSDKQALRSLLYPFPSRDQQTEHPHQTVELIPTEAEKMYNVKIPTTYIKALEQHSGQTKQYGFSQMSFGDKPGSYSYSIFNKHS